MSVRLHEDPMAGIPEPTIRAAADALRETTTITDRRR